MRKLTTMIFVVTTVILLLSFNFIEAQVIPPKARATSPGGPTIDQAQREDAMGTKARVSVSRFVDKSAKGKSSGQIGEGMSEMLSNALFATNRYIVLERQSLPDVLQEQDLGASGRVKPETAAKIGEIEGADLLIQGTITEFEPGTAAAGGGVGGVIPLPGRAGRVVGGMGGGVGISHVAMVVKVIDAKTSRVLASEQIEGKATDVGGMAGMAGGGLAGAFGAYSKTPMEKAIRVAIEEAVRVIVSKTPPEYYRASTTQPQTPPPIKTATPISPPTRTATPTFPITKAPQITEAPGPEPRIAYVKWPSVSLREGPGMNFRVLLEVKRGTALAVLEEQGQWLRIGLEDGREGWIGRATTSEIP